MLTNFFTGWKLLCVEAPLGVELLELCRAHGLPYDSLTPTPDGGLTLRMRAATAKTALSLCAHRGIPVCVVAEGGFPRMAKRMLCRPGLWVGGILAALLIFLSTAVVWDVRVEGNTTLSERAVEDALASCGFGVGSPLWGFRADELQNRVLMADKRLAWISVNMSGTVAYVEVRETVHPAPREDENAPVNVVASVGGQVTRVELTRGNLLVSAGQWVGEGDLLVSGVYDSLQTGIRVTHAKARVYARTMRHLTVEIPLSHEEKAYFHPDGAVPLEKSLIFFGKSIKFSNKTRNDGGFCDTIEGVYVPFAQFGVGFPISLRQTWLMPYAVVSQTYTYAEAEELAYLELSRQILALGDDVEILAKEITVTRAPDALLLSCDLTCIMDIAVEKPFEVEG